jgi:RNA polymerase-binding transcription factor DksA
MIAPFEVSCRAGRAADKPLTARQAERLHDRLLAATEKWTAQYAREAAKLAVLTADPSEDPTGLDRAMAALGMYGAIEAIEKIEDALVRVTDDQYGTCQSCDRPISFERLEMIPQTRLCAVCLTADEGPTRSRRDTRGGERTDALPPPPSALEVLRVAHDPRVFAESRARHPSSVRHEHALDNPSPKEPLPIVTRRPN